MPDETKVPPPGGPPETPSKAGEAASGAPAQPPQPAQPVATAAKPPAEAPKPAAPAKPAAPTAKPSAPAAKPAVKPEPWANPLVDELEKRFPGATTNAVIFRNQPSIVVARESLLAVCEFLKGDDGGAYTLLTDETAVDYPKREKRFEIIYQLYSFKQNHRLRLKVVAAEGEPVPSVCGIWPTANWLEREVFDMFGVQYEGHPNLKRILLPEDWVGYPLRKDYDILRQDDAWVRANLNISSGQ
jgi:NADH-quinone oxidoreductase subunit C